MKSKCCQPLYYTKIPRQHWDGFIVIWATVRSDILDTQRSYDLGPYGDTWTDTLEPQERSLKDTHTTASVTELNSL